MATPGARLDELRKALSLSRQQVADRIGSSRATIDNCVNDNRPPRDLDQYRRLVELLHEDPFATKVSVGDGPAVALDDLPTEQVLDLLARLLRNPSFASALADRLGQREPRPRAFGVFAESTDDQQQVDDPKPDDRGTDRTAEA